MEGGLVVSYMQMNSLGAGRDCGTGMGGAVNITVRATTALFSHLINNSIDAHLCFSLFLTHSLASLFFFFRTLALNLNSGSLGVSLLLMRPSLVNSYRAPLVDTEGELITKYVVIIIRETTMCGWVVDRKRLAWLWLDGVMGCVRCCSAIFLSM